VLYLFGFKRLGVVLSDLYFVDPDPAPGQEGPERGVRLEVRWLNQPEQEGSIYASRPIVLDRPLWRADLLESVSHPGSLDRAHHHPNMREWEPGLREFEPELTADPVAWVAKRLADFRALMEAAGVEDSRLDDDDLEELSDAAPEVADAIRRLLGRIGQGDLARPPADSNARTSVRAGWL
jgi:hypothetical protein